MEDDNYERAIESLKAASRMNESLDHIQKSMDETNKGLDELLRFLLRAGIIALLFAVAATYWFTTTIRWDLVLPLIFGV
jgi:hypothetical protein